MQELLTPTSVEIFCVGGQRIGTQVSMEGTKLARVQKSLFSAHILVMPNFGHNPKLYVNIDLVHPVSYVNNGSIHLRRY